MIGSMTFEEAIRSKAPETAYAHFIDGFNDFVYSYYNCRNQAMSGEWMILENSNSDEEAFDKYFELRDAFLNQEKSGDSLSE